MKPQNIKPATVIIMSLFLIVALWAWRLTAPQPKQQQPVVVAAATVQSPLMCWQVTGFARDADIGVLNGYGDEVVPYALRLRCFGCTQNNEIWIDVQKAEYDYYRRERKKPRPNMTRCDSVYYAAY